MGGIVGHSDQQVALFGELVEQCRKTNRVRQIGGPRDGRGKAGYGRCSLCDLHDPVEILPLALHFALLGNCTRPNNAVARGMVSHEVVVVNDEISSLVAHTR